MFTVITDCHALKWIQTYEGDNAAVRRLQFGIIGYNFTCCHRLRHLNEDGDGLSQLSIDTLLGANITGSYSDNATLNQYYELATQFSKDSPSPVGAMTPDKLPGYRRKRSINGPGPKPIDPPINEDPIANMAFSHTSIAFVDAPNHGIHASTLFNNEIVCAAHSASKFNWIVHGWGSGTFFDSIKQNSVPFTVHAAMDIYPQGRNLMQSFANVPHIFSNSDELLTYITRALNCSVQGDFVTIPALDSRSDNNRYFRYQIEIIARLKQNHKLMMIAFQMHDCTTRTITDKF